MERERERCNHRVNVVQQKKETPTQNKTLSGFGSVLKTVLCACVSNEAKATHGAANIKRGRERERKKRE